MPSTPVLILISLSDTQVSVKMVNQNREFIYDLLWSLYTVFRSNLSLIFETIYKN